MFLTEFLFINQLSMCNCDNEVLFCMVTVLFGSFHAVQINSSVFDISNPLHWYIK